MSCEKLLKALAKGNEKEALAQMPKCDLKTLKVDMQQKVADFHKKMYCGRLNIDTDTEKIAFCGGNGKSSSGAPVNPFDKDRSLTGYDIVIPKHSAVGSGGGRTGGGT